MYKRQALGEEGLRQAYNQALEAAKAAGGLDRQVEARPVTKQGEGSISGRRIIAQKQPGLFAASYHPLGGTPSRQTLRALLDTIQPMEQVEVRLGADGTMYAVSYTHLDVYKRQTLDTTLNSMVAGMPANTTIR